MTYASGERPEVGDVVEILLQFRHVPFTGRTGELVQWTPVEYGCHVRLKNIVDLPPPQNDMTICYHLRELKLLRRSERKGGCDE